MCPADIGPTTKSPDLAPGEATHQNQSDQPGCKTMGAPHVALTAPIGQSLALGFRAAVPAAVPVVDGEAGVVPDGPPLVDDAKQKIGVFA
jgi:hypothetical protein